MLTIVILISLFGIIAAISGIIGERKKRIRAKRKLERFEIMSPPKGNKND